MISTATFTMRVVGFVLVFVAVSEVSSAHRHRTTPFNPGPRIVNGTQATRGQFPHQVAVDMDDNYFCGGSLISTSWILTAGHCIFYGEFWTITLGAQTLSSTTEEGRLVVLSRTAILHEEYSPYYLHNDLGVIKLDDAITLNDYIKPVELPRRSMEGNSFDGQAVILSGWGRTNTTAPTVSDELNYVNLEVIPLTDCMNFYGNLFNYTICAQAVGKSACYGDSGGPLVIVGADGSYTEVGIASFGSEDGCIRGYPNGYTRVTYYLDWITENTGITIKP